jgi:hypothetical protein
LAGLLAAAGLSGCNVVGDVYAAHLETFSPSEYAWSTRAGGAAISGHAVSDATTWRPGPCNGPVILVPDGAYMANHTPSTAEPLVPRDETYQRGLTYAGNVLPPVVEHLARRTSCDPDGRFAFSGLPDGPYILFVTARGGVRTMVFRLRLSEGRTRQVELRHTCATLPHRKRIGGVAEACGIAPLRVRPPPGDPNF